jgi:AP2 domain
MRLSKNNKSGYRGVSWNKQQKKWHVKIGVNGKHVHLGYFKDLEEASQAYMDGIEKYGKHNYLNPKTADAKKYRKDDYEKNKDRYQTYHRKWEKINNRKLREEIIEAYGSKCVCCNENIEWFLCIDHINGNGCQERRELKLEGTKFYKWLKKQGFPKEDYQLLCHNCNFAKGTGKECPHKIIAKQIVDDFIKSLEQCPN